MLIEKIFFDHFTEGTETLFFVREDLESAASDLDIVLPKNLGDVVYAMRYRTPLPASVEATQRDGKGGATCPAADVGDLF